jgi:predicted ATP-dependent Lon-type protease
MQEKRFKKIIANVLIENNQNFTVTNNVIQIRVDGVLINFNVKNQTINFIRGGVWCLIKFEEIGTDNNKISFFVGKIGVFEIDLFLVKKEAN